MEVEYKCRFVLARGERSVKRCGKPGAQAQFTVQIKYATDENPQPAWLCDEHRGLFPSVSAMTGEVIRKATKGVKHGERDRGDGGGTRVEGLVA